MTLSSQNTARRVQRGTPILWLLILSALSPQSALCLYNPGDSGHFARAQLRIPPIPGQEPAKPWCRIAATPSIAGTELLDSVPVISDREVLTYVYLVSAGRLLTVAIQNQLLQNARFHVTVSSKPTDEGPFVPICKNIRFPASNMPYLEAHAPSNLAGSVWRIEVTVAAATNPDVRPTVLQIEREPNSDFDPEWSTLHGPWNDALGYLCIDADAQTLFSKTRSLREFGARVRLDVDTDQPSFSWTPAQRQGLEMVILRAVSLWVTSCSACKFEHLAVVKIGNQLFLREGVANWLNDWTRRFRSHDVASLQPLESSLKEAIEPVHLLEAGTSQHPQLTKKAFVQYVKVNPQQDYSAFCESRVHKDSAPVLWNVQTAFCSPDRLDKLSTASIRVRFRDGSTVCGDSPNIIACRADLELTEYNSRDFSFAFDDRKLPPIGRGHIQVSLLHALMHEMGHWIGLPHIEGGESIMASGLDRSRCIDYRTLRALARQQLTIFNGPSAFTMHSGGKRRPSREDVCSVRPKGATISAVHFVKDPAKTKAGNERNERLKRNK